jgi:3-oxoacyl-[acyl-carrier-protein] synthase-1
MTAWLGAPGIVCALGSGIAQVTERALRGDTSGMVRQDGWIGARAITVGAAADTDTLAPIPADMPRHYDTRNNRLLLTALLQIEPEVMHAMIRYGPDRVGIVLGTSTAGINENTPAFRALARDGAWPPDYDYRRQALSAPAAFLADWIGFAGPAYTLSTACTSSARALLSAKRLLDMGVCDAVLCGGVDSLCQLTINGFASIEAIAPALCNPFSAHRNGINIGEGAAVFLMQRERSGGPAIALLGGGGSSDAWHMSAPDPSGAGAATAMRAALQDAAVDATEIGWLNLHGTGTPHNDAMESHAVHALFPHGVPCTATKSMTGHALAAAGAIEAALCWAVLSPANGGAHLPPHVWDGAADPTLPALDLTGPSHRLPQGGRPIVMSNSFAFGGNNASLVFGAPQ